MRCVFIYNPHSGKGKINKYISYVEKVLRSRFEEVQIRASQKAGDLTAFAEEACENCDVLVFSGGDGTFNEVLQGVSAKENRPVLGYIPTGTCNDIARTYGIPFSIKKAVRNVVKGQARAVDSISINNRFAEYVVCAGAFTTTTYQTPQTSKKKFGRLAYFYDGVRRNLVPPTFRVKLTSSTTSVETDSNFISFINSRSVAGIPLNRKAVLDDGLIDALIVRVFPNRYKQGKIRGFFKVIKIFLFGVGKTLMRDSEIVKIRDSRFEVEIPDSVFWNYDGEQGDSGKVVIEVLKQHVKLIIPEKTIRKFEKQQKISK